MKLLSTHTADGHKFYLYELDESWAPWSFRIEESVLDGKAYGRPKLETTTSNFKTEDQARKVFAECLRA